MKTLRLEVRRAGAGAAHHQGPHAGGGRRRFLPASPPGPGLRGRRGAVAGRTDHGRRGPQGAGPGPIRRCARHRRRPHDHGRNAGGTGPLRRGGQAPGRERPDQQRPRDGSGLADRPGPGRHRCIQPLQRLRCGRFDAADRADRITQETPQRHRAGHPHPDPQQEPGDREALAEYRSATATTPASSRSSRSRCAARSSAPRSPRTARPGTRRPETGRAAARRKRSRRRGSSRRRRSRRRKRCARRASPKRSKSGASTATR